MWVHFALPFLTGVSTTPVQSGLIGLTLNAAANFAEIIRGGVNAIPREQWEAARAVGLRRPLVWRLVILPQVIRVVLPTLVNMTISIFKGTTIISILSVGELLQVVNRISNYTFKAVEIFTFAALVYLFVGLLLDAIARRIERRLKEGLAR
jgi:polar amino acid transport system permease protein